jgi:hypothetical protein
MASARDRESSELEEEEPYNSWHKDGHYYGDAQCNCYECLSGAHGEVLMTQRQKQENDMLLWSGRRSPGGSDKSLPCYDETSDNNK